MIFSSNQTSCNKNQIRAVDFSISIDKSDAVSYSAVGIYSERSRPRMKKLQKIPWSHHSYYEMIEKTMYQTTQTTIFQGPLGPLFDTSTWGDQKRWHAAKTCGEKTSTKRTTVRRQEIPKTPTELRNWEFRVVQRDIYSRSH